MDTKRVYAPSEGVLLPDGTPASRQMRPVQAAALSMITSLTHKEAHDFTSELQDMLDFEASQAAAGDMISRGQEICLEAVKIIAACQLDALKLVSQLDQKQPQEAADEAQEDQDETPSQAKTELKLL